jgi:hypothetical protein
MGRAFLVLAGNLAVDHGNNILRHVLGLWGILQLCQGIKSTQAAGVMLHTGVGVLSLILSPLEASTGNALVLLKVEQITPAVLKGRHSRKAGRLGGQQERKLREGNQ